MYNFKKLLLVPIFSTIITILFVSFMSLPAFQSKYFYSPIINNLTASETTTNYIVSLMEKEIPLFKESFQDNPKESSGIQKIMSMFNYVDTNNRFTLLINGEIPSLDFYADNTFGVNNNQENTPIESPPPDFKELLDKEPSNTDEDENENGNKENSTKNKQADVFIYHSHSWEAFLPLMESGTKPSDASSINNKENVVYAGELLSSKLESLGVSTIHDTTNVTKELHERGWNYYNSYQFSRETIEETVAANKRLQYFIDIHRDAARHDVTTVTIDGKKYAKLFFIVGKENKNFEANHAFAKKLNKELESKYPGISRGIFIKDKSQGNGVYNQDISENSMLIELGGVDNTKEELKNTSDVLAKVLSDYIIQAEKVNN
ncbi:stage II sporulation protein P [Aquibacillus kalidii]|uniref:stage II sporulation protein P n=1 Tax=Aquibacillus kalidii TaxID=2762597 RepID=UPI0016470437|nr:stage II sporulation protein P [Aquibacillus kalidii]